jgi:ribosomal protein S18 acetylase RimI-like enzyme
MDPIRDLKGIAELVADAFADEVDERGRAALREMRWMARLSPLVWWWSRADPSFHDTFNGFVWEGPTPKGKRRRIVGNVSLSKAPGSSRYWIICNVVVKVEHRGRGIGQRLTEAAIAEAHKLGAAGIVLQVYEDNLPALRLYTDLGFREVSGETALRLDAVRSVAFLNAPGHSFRGWRPSDGQAAYELARQVTPLALQWLRPVRVSDYRLEWWNRLGRWLADLLAGRRTYCLTTLKDDRLAALMTVKAAFRGDEHELALLVDPEDSGQIEPALISRALHMLSAIPPKPVKAKVNKEQTATLKALRSYGFKDNRTLLTMQKDF